MPIDKGYAAWGVISSTPLVFFDLTDGINQ
jgi:hypothetical protein